MILDSILMIGSEGLGSYQKEELSSRQSLSQCLFFYEIYSQLEIQLGDSKEGAGEKYLHSVRIIFGFPYLQCSAVSVPDELWPSVFRVAAFEAEQMKYV